MKLVEGMSKNGNVFVEGILATVEVKNGNGRYYKRELWEREIDNFTRKIQMKSTETVGELDHPDSQVINLKNASHAIREVWWRGDEIWGKVEIFSDIGDLGTTSGRIAGALVKNGLIIGISSRGMGSLKQMGEVMEVQDDFELLTWDLYTPVQVLWIIFGNQTQVFTSNKGTIQTIENTLQWTGFTQYFQDKFLKYYLGS